MCNSNHCPGPFHLRKLSLNDIPFMLEWINDLEIRCFFRFTEQMIDVSIIRNFIETTTTKSDELHLACVDTSNIYLGTVSLKKINLVSSSAEYAISFRRQAHGTGAALYATYEILRTAFFDYELKFIYLKVYSDNTRAINFYYKVGFKRNAKADEYIMINGKKKLLLQFQLIETDFCTLG